MATTTMHFGPEWMRAKPQTPARQQPPPSPPPQAPSTTQQQLGASTYSALVTPVTQELDKRDDSRPFRYTKEEMLRIYKEGGGKGGLNLEVERWEGIVRDVASEPAGLREMSEAEKKLFAGPLNSELRRRQSTDLMNSLSSPSDRQRLSHSNSATNNTMRYGSFLGRRRDSTDQPPLSLPRKLSISNTQGATLTSPRDALPSPRNRMGAFGSGFDGVLNSGDVRSKRRPPAGVTGAGGVLARGDGREEDTRRSEIKEEAEIGGHHSPHPRGNNPVAVTGRSPSPGPETSQSDATPDNQVPSSEFDLPGRSMAGMSLEGHNQTSSKARTSPTINPLSSGPPPGLTDPASIEWSYLDPQGQVQGPFRADLMQKWFDEGYFTADLLMKRTHIDANWVAVGILERHVAGAGGKIFLSHISTGPPGLTIRTESPKNYSPIHEQCTFNGYHPVPTQTLRPALDPYLNGSSPADSPSSSLGGGRFGNGSPDPSTFGGRTGSSVCSNDPNLGGRAIGGRAVLQDPISDARTLNSNLGRAPSIDTFNIYNGGGDNSPWSAGAGQISQGFNDSDQRPYSNGFSSAGAGAIGNALPINHIHGINQEHFGDTTYSTGSLRSHHDLTAPRHPPDTNGMSFNGNMINGPGSQLSAPTQFSQPSSAPYVPQHCQPFGDLQAPEAPNVTQTPTSAIQPNGASPWTAHTMPFETSTAPSPVVPPARPQASEWITPQPAPLVDPSPWLMASLPVVEDVWREMPGPNSLTFSNLGQHNKLQQQEEDGANDVVVSPVEDDTPAQLDTQPAQTKSTDAVSVDATAVASHSAMPANTSTLAPVPQAPTSKARRKSTVRDLQVPACKVAPPPTATVVKEQTSASAAPVAQSKPAWIIDDDSKKKKGTGITMSLREIQEAEARKAETRKAERERERLARASAVSVNSAVEESQTFTSSWGLPTSQAGARSAIPPKETAPTSSVSATPAAPVWTNASPATTAKKTMKEIQEEEERRKKLAVRDSMATAAARRAYAETTVKVVPITQASSGPWTTVGPNGKPTPPTNLPRPTANTNSAPSNPAPAIAVHPNGTATRQATTTMAKIATSRVEDFPVTPSHDFLKWLNESLKGLNSSVNLEEITSMLLSFPLDPDQSTMEIISDLIYANSTTLDGRRFASEFVNKRRADAATRRGTAGPPGSSNKPVSIADVVKTQPKPVQQEWGFKVVNKRKKGGRS